MGTSMADLSILFFGMDCPFSRPPLAALLANHTVRAVVVPRAPGLPSREEPVRRLPLHAPSPYHIPLLPISSAASVPRMAGAAGVPVLEVAGLRDPRTLAALAAFRPDLICVACFPRLLPGTLLHLPRLGAINLHPALLPAYRGPAPLFWIFHDGLEHAGVTAHLMDEGADTGDILAQRPISLPDGIRYHAAEEACATAGAALVLEAIQALATGSATPRPQPPGSRPAAPWPTDAEYLITPAWSARRAFNFIRGVGSEERPVDFAHDGAVMPIVEAISFDAEATLPVPLRRAGHHLQFRCSPGVLTVMA
jgi:methionyl-tRNA formyltransferase